MISFWVTRAGSTCIRAYMDKRGRAIAGRFETPAYDDIGPVVQMRGGTQIFSTLDHLTATQRDVAQLLWSAHATNAPAARRLNDPGRVLLRFELLTRLHAEGINSFRVFAADSDEAMRFPVFVRERNRHNGPLTGLLEDADAVRDAVSAFKLRGYRLRDLMIVEFCDASGADGLFRKYAAFKVGDRIIAGHMFASGEWFLKSGSNAPSEESLAEEAAYLEANPHREWLDRVFTIAGIGFGRIDYGVAGGVPQAWEINLNPTMGRSADFVHHHVLPPHLDRLREQGREAFHARLRDAFVALDTAQEEGTIAVPIPATLLAALRAEMAGDKRRERVLTALRTLYMQPRIGMPLRAVFSRLFPRR